MEYILFFRHVSSYMHTYILQHLTSASFRRISLLNILTILIMLSARAVTLFNTISPCLIKCCRFFLKSSIEMQIQSRHGNDTNEPFH